MILPNTYEMTLLLSVLSMILWGSWANTLKLTGPKWRFELFYFDFAFGVLITAIAAAFTFGSMGEELSFSDNVMLSGRRQMMWAVVGGGVFNLANMLLVAATALAGMSVAFPIAIGLALIIGTTGNYVVQKTGNPMFIFGGIALVLLAIVFAAMAYAAKTRESALDAQHAGKGRPRAGKGIIISIVSGILMGSFYPLVLMARRPSIVTDIALGPYAIAFFFAIGVFFSTLVYNLYFINLPVYGQATSIGEYFQGTVWHHLLGVLGGVIWCSGTVANFVAGAATGNAQLSSGLSYALGHGATMIAALWGVLAWREFKGSGGKTLLYLALMFLLFLAGIGLVSVAPRL